MFIGLPTREWPLNAPATMATIDGVLRRYGGTLGVLAHSPWVDLARSELSTGQFLASKEQELLWVDSDISFDPAIVETMRAAKAPIVTCTYRKRIKPHDFAMRTLRGEHPTEAPLRTVLGKRVIEIESDGMGCCLVQRHVIEALCARHPELAYVSDNGPRYWLHQPFIATLDGVRRSAHDDMAFFLRARAAGFKVECLVDAVITHDGVRGCLAEVFPDAQAARTARGLELLRFCLQNEGA